MTTKLSPCKNGVAAVEQSRGAMGAGDYKEMQKINNKGRMVDDFEYYKDVHLDDYNRNDFRVSCTECDNATPWEHVPENTPFHLLDDIVEAVHEKQRRMWNEVYSKKCQHMPALSRIKTSE